MRKYNILEVNVDEWNALDEKEKVDYVFSLTHATAERNQNKSETRDSDYHEHMTASDAIQALKDLGLA